MRHSFRRRLQSVRGGCDGKQPLTDRGGDLYGPFREGGPREGVTLQSLLSSVWYRYVDDVLVFWRKSEEEFNRFVSLLNGIRDCIRFAKEMEQDGTLQVLGYFTRQEWR